MATSGPSLGSEARSNEVEGDAEPLALEQARPAESPAGESNPAVEPALRNPIAILKARFGLTAAETRVLQQLAEGLSYADVAGQLGNSYNTVHTHVKSIHRKTGVTTNLRLVALVRTTG